MDMKRALVKQPSYQVPEQEMESFHTDHTKKNDQAVSEDNYK